MSIYLIFIVFRYLNFSNTEIFELFYLHFLVSVSKWNMLLVLFFPRQKSINYYIIENNIWLGNILIIYFLQKKFKVLTHYTQVLSEQPKYT